MKQCLQKCLPGSRTSKIDTASADQTKKFIQALEFISLFLSPRRQSWEVTSISEMIPEKRNRQGRELCIYYMPVVRRWEATKEGTVETVIVLREVKCS